MKFLYYPGCTLIEKAKNLDISARSACRALGIELVEMPDWTCCGTVFPLNTRKIVGVIAPARILLNAIKEGYSELVTLCAFCYNVLKRTNFIIKNDPLVHKRVNVYLKDEFERENKDYQEYCGEVKVLHLLEVLRDKFGFSTLKQKVVHPLAGLNLAAYYGCMFLRPEEEVAFDRPEDPKIMDDFIMALGASPVYFPYRIECCGSYLSMSSEEIALQGSFQIIQSAQKYGADALVLSCPLCHYNLDKRQEKMSKDNPYYKPLPILYFTQVLGMALGIEEKDLLWDMHYISPQNLFQKVKATTKQEAAL